MHAHWHHIGGLAGLKAPSTQVIAQASFVRELEIANGTGAPLRYFFGGEAPRRYELHPDRRIDRAEVVTVGGLEFALYPVRGAETEDALMIHVPERGPYLGAPFLPEGSPEALFDNIALIHSLQPRRLIHGHPPLTDLFTVEVLPVLETAMRELWPIRHALRCRSSAGMPSRPCAHRNQQLNPFKFIVYSEWAGADLPAVEQTASTWP